MTTSINRIAEKLELFITNSEAYISSLHEELGENFRRQMDSFKRNILGDATKNETAEITVLLRRLKPSITEIVGEYREIPSKYIAAKKEFDDAKDTDSESYQKIKKKYEDFKKLYGEIENVIDIPDSTVESLKILAERARTRVKDVEDDINQLRKEIELWFDRSMDRATGVYKRNAKGISIIIGFLLAAAVNADTFHIVSRLSKDSTLRTVIAERASQANLEKTNQDLLKETNQDLAKYSLPIGRDTDNINQQKEESKDWRIGSWSFRKVRRYLGWLISGIALSTGAPFWFDLLNRVVNVRNAGKPPKSSSDTIPTKEEP